MKKFLTIVLSVALMLSALSLLVLNTAAEETEENETSFKFGNATIDMTLIENFHSVEGNTFMGWGQFSVVDQMMKLEVSGGLIWDAYGLKTNMLSANTTFPNAVNFVISIKDNRSDGDVFFSFQPHSPNLASNDGNLFTGWVEGQTVWLVDEKGKATEAQKCPSMDLMSGRAGYILPMGFEGYIVFPIKNLVIHGDWGTTYYSNPADVDIDSVGFHVALDDATYAEFCIDDLFICGELPAYEKPAPETKPVETTPEATVPAETKPEETPAETPAETPVESAPVDTTPANTAAEDTTPAAPAESATDTTPETEAPAGGCGAVMGLVALPVVFLGAVALRRRED